MKPSLFLKKSSKKLLETLVGQDFPVRENPGFFIGFIGIIPDMNERMPTIQSTKNLESKTSGIEKYVENFCAEWKPETQEEQEVFNKAIQDIENSLDSFSKGGIPVSFDKRKKEFTADGKVVPKSYFAVASIWGKDFAFEENGELPFDYKQMKKKYQSAWIKEEVSKKLSPVIASIEAGRNRKDNAAIAHAYSAIEERFGQESSEQIGSRAEQVVRSFLTRIAAEVQDLKIEIHPANPYQDVHQKIDFIIEVTSKKRGVGIVEDENISHTLGIQFTVNDSKIEHKKEQIQKAKNRAMDIDDIILVAVNQNIMSSALEKWQKSGDSFREPAEFLTYDTRMKLLRELFTNLLSPEDVEKIIKKYS